MSSAGLPVAPRTPWLLPPLQRSRPLRFLFAAAAGVLLALSFPDAALSLLVFLFLVPLLASLVTAESKREAALQGWLFYTVQWLITVPWVIRVMSHYGGLPYLLGVGIFIVMALYLGLFGALFGWIAFVLLRGRRPFRGVVHASGWLLVPLVWAAVEYLRTYAMTGFPWDLVATAIVDLRPLVLVDRWVGPYALGAMICVPSAVIAWALVTPAEPRMRTRVTGALGIFLVLWLGAGMLIARTAAGPSGRVHHAALLQPNISQEMRWDSTSLQQIFSRMTEMTDTALQHGAELVIWPESTVPLTYESSSFYRDAIEARSATTHTDVILGSVAQDPHDPNRLWNAAYLVSDGKTIGHYDKTRLVPFGEYVPLRKAFFFAGKLVHAVGSFEFGTRETPLAGKLSYGLAICYEVVFPQIPATQVRNGATVLVTITNDAWYDGTSAPKQHLDMVRLRAVENDRYILRAGTTGISAFIAPDGRILQSLAMGKSGIVYVDFTPRSTKTPYLRSGDLVAWLLSAAVAVALLLRIRR